MTPGQYYWTTIADRFSDRTLSFAVVPARSFNSGQIPAQVEQQLGFTSLTGPELEAWHLPTILAELLKAGVLPQALSVTIANLRSGTQILVDPFSLGFAQYVAHSDLIPFEQSPLKGKSLMSIALGGGIKIGLLAGAGSPIVLLTVPLGIIVCTAAAAVGPALGEKLVSLIRSS
jgi:hypothetical protein